MLATLLAMAAIVGTWLLLLALYVGVGLLVRRLVGLRRLDAGGLLDTFWVGWCATLFGLQLWHLVWPVEPWASVGFAVLGAAGLAWNRGSIASARLDAALPARSFRWFLLGLSLLLLYLALRAVQGPANYDSGLYHLGAVRWAEAYPIVPGLANLHDRFGYNNSYFLYVAMLDSGLWDRRAHHVANGLLLFAMLARIAVAVFELFGRGERFRLRDVFLAVFLVPLLRATMEADISSPAPDLAVTILGAVVLAMLIDRFEIERDRRGSGEDRFGLLALLVVAATGITVKLSFVALGGMTAAVAMVAWCWNRVGSRSFAAVAAVAGITILGLWAARGVVLSGYPAFPSRVGAFPVDWRVPESMVAAHIKQIQGYARNRDEDPNEVVKDWRWLGPWARRALRNRSEFVTPLVVAILGCALALHRMRRRQDGVLPWRTAWLFLLPPTAALVFWFFTAPSFRFLGATTWGLAAFGLVLAANGLTRLPRWVAAALLIGLVISVCSSRVTSRHVHWLPEGPGGFEPIPEAPIREYSTASGLTLHVPVEGDQCWDAPLPCTPYPRPALRARSEGELAAGFRVEEGE